MGSSSVNHLASSNSKNLKQGTCGQTGYRTNVTHKEYGRNAKSEVDDIDFEMQLCYNEGFSDENDYMWLSFSGIPPCFQSSENRQLMDTSGIDFSDVLLYYQFSGTSPLSRCDRAFFDVDQKNLASDKSNASSTGASLLFDKTEGCGAEGQDNCLGDDEIKRYYMGYSEGVEFGGRRSFSEDSSTVDSSWTSLGTWDEPFPLRDYGLDTLSVWLPLIDLEGEEPKWDADDLDVLDQDFLGPSCHRRMNLQAKSSSFSCSPNFNQLLNAQVSLESSNSAHNLSPEDVLDVKYLPEDSDADEPLFWPFDQKSYWSTELEWNCLDISPFGSILNIGSPTGGHPPKLFQFRLHQRNNSSLHGKNIQQRYKDPTSSQSHLAGHESRDPSSRIPNDTGTPSERSRSSTRLPPDMATCSLFKEGGGKDLHRLDSLINKHDLHQKTSLDEHLLQFEADDFQIYLTGGIPIEALLGLDEFDGHEGIGRVTAGWSTEDFSGKNP